jgi:hypothetical protein
MPQARASRIARASRVPRGSASAIEVASRRASRPPKCVPTALMSTSESDGPHPHDGTTSRRSRLLARVIAKFAKSDRVVAVSRLAQLYDVTAIKSSCYAGGGTGSSLFGGISLRLQPAASRSADKCSDPSAARNRHGDPPSRDHVRWRRALSDYSGATSASASDVSRQRKQAAPCSGPTAAIAGTSSRQRSNLIGQRL